MNNENSLHNDALPEGMSKKELLRMPQLAKVRRLFKTAGVFLIIAGIAGFLMEIGASAGNTILTAAAVIDSLLDVGLGIGLCTSASVTYATILAVIFFVNIAYSIAMGRSPGGVLVLVLLISGLVKFNRAWREYKKTGAGAGALSAAQSKNPAAGPAPQAAPAGSLVPGAVKEAGEGPALQRQKNEDHRMDHVEDADYGLSPVKPVFVCGAAERSFYLSHLAADSGNPLIWKMKYRVNDDSVYGDSEAFEGIRADTGEREGMVYINGYTNRLGHFSHNAPAGFVFKDEAVSQTAAV